MTVGRVVAASGVVKERFLTVGCVEGPVVGTEHSGYQWPYSHRRPVFNAKRADTNGRVSVTGRVGA